MEFRVGKRAYIVKFLWRIYFVHREWFFFVKLDSPKSNVFL